MQGDRRVGIAGVGIVPFDKYEDELVEDIARPAVIAALKDAGLERGRIEAAFVSHLYQGEVLGQRILKGLQVPGDYRHQYRERLRRRFQCGARGLAVNQDRPA